MRTKQRAWSHPDLIVRFVTADQSPSTFSTYGYPGWDKLQASSLLMHAFDLSVNTYIQYKRLHKDRYDSKYCTYVLNDTRHELLDAWLRLPWKIWELIRSNANVLIRRSGIRIKQREDGVSFEQQQSCWELQIWKVDVMDCLSRLAGKAWEKEVKAWLSPSISPRGVAATIDSSPRCFGNLPCLHSKEHLRVETSPSAWKFQG